MSWQSSRLQISSLFITTTNSLSNQNQVLLVWQLYTRSCLSTIHNPFGVSQKLDLEQAEGNNLANCSVTCFYIATIFGDKLFSTQWH